MAWTVEVRVRTTLCFEDILVSLGDLTRFTTRRNLRFSPEVHLPNEFDHLELSPIRGPMDSGIPIDGL